jgi:hypothetical protein
MNKSLHVNMAVRLLFFFPVVGILIALAVRAEDWFFTPARCIAASSPMVFTPK